MAPLVGIEHKNEEEDQEDPKNEGQKSGIKSRITEIKDCQNAHPHFSHSEPNRAKEGGTTVPCVTFASRKVTQKRNVGVPNSLPPTNPEIPSLENREKKGGDWEIHLISKIRSEIQM